MGKKDDDEDKGSFLGNIVREIASDMGLVKENMEEMRERLQDAVDDQKD